MFRSIFQCSLINIYSVIFPGKCLHFLWIWVSQLGSESQLFKDQDVIPGHVDLPPLKTMSTRILESMVVVMPSFTLCKNTNKWIVHGKVVSFEHLSTINMTYGVNSPSDMPDHNLSHSEAPDNSW
jgi:hypothetical protein